MLKMTLNKIMEYIKLEEGDDILLLPLTIGTVTDASPAVTSGTIALTTPSLKDKHKQHLNNKNNNSNKCLLLQNIISHNKLINFLLALCVIIIIIPIIYFSKNYAKTLLIWIEKQNSWIIFLLFMLLFSIVSFPVTIGYLILIVTSGYLFGIIKGLLTVILGANLGVVIAHNTIKSVQSKLPVHRLIKNETGRAILRVIAGPRAFKVVLFARLTPIPFGLQNTIFGVSAVNSRSYHTATLLGLLPAQAINVYLGSTLRSMHDVLNDNKTALTGYCMFAIQVLIGVSLMVWVVQKARTELSTALLSDMGVQHKLLVEIEA